MSLSILMVGCGNMGAALLSCWVEHDYKITVLSPHIFEKKFDFPDNFEKCANIDDIDPGRRFDAVILAVKPQIMDEVYAEIQDIVAPDTILISIAAGKTIDDLETLRGDAGAVIRVMPNTPVKIRAGVSGVCANNSVSKEQHEQIKNLFALSGQVIDIPENLFDVMTAISGSGPAYLFYFIEALAKAGEANGLDPDIAMTLARETIIGSAKLAEANHTKPISHMRANVTSPGGVTAEALKIMMRGEFQEILDKAIEANIKRSKEL